MLLVALAGCTSPGGVLSDAAVPSAAPAFEAVPILGRPVAEPAIAQHPDGALFVAGFVPRFSEASSAADATLPLLLRSDDAGGSWMRVEQGRVAQGAIGNSDTDLAVAPDGTLYHATMLFFPWGHAISVGASEDAGATWTWRRLMAGPWVDRPWVEVGPDGVAHVTWSSPLGLHHATSDDRGRTWTEGPRVHDTSGSGGLAVGPGGEIAIRLLPYRAPTFLGAAFVFPLIDPTADGVVVSTDGGATWTVREIPGERAYGDPFGNDRDQPRWADPVGFDGDGTLYTAWCEGDAVQLAWSRDLGASWDVLTVARTEGRTAFFPYLRAGAAGALALTWFTEGDGGVRAHIARVEGADTATPLIDAREHDMPREARLAGEYFQAAFLAEGPIVAATPIDTGEDTTSGFVFLTLRGDAR